MTSVSPDYPKEYSIYRCYGATTFKYFQWDLRNNVEKLHGYISLRCCKMAELQHFECYTLFDSELKKI